MQILNAPDVKQFQSIEAALQKERVGRYMPAANKDPIFAFKLYMWNCDLCEAFYIPLHFAEILCRNYLHHALIRRSGQNWYNNQTFRSLLDPRFVNELDEAVRMEGRQHGAKLTEHHVVSALTFGFWEHLTTKRFERFLWAKGVTHVFPGAPATLKREELHGQIESVRRWRNRIAHHRAIFDKSPSKKHQDALNLIQWCCGDTAEWLQSISRVSKTVNARPK